MKILFISPQIPLPATDGGKIVKWGLIKYLSLSGNKVYFVSYRNHTIVKDVYEELNRYTTPYILDVQTDNNVIKAIKNLLSPVPYNVSKFIHNELSEFIISFLSQNDVDLVLVNNIHMGWIIDHIKKVKDVPVFLRQENVEMIIMKRFYEQQKNILFKLFAYLQYVKFKSYEPNLCRKFDSCLMISNVDKMTIKSFDKNIRATVLPVGIDPKLFEFFEDNIIPFSIAHIGSLTWLPNLDGLQWFLDEVFPQLVKKFPNSKIFIYGNGDYSKLKFSMKIENNLEFVGFVEDIWKEIKNKSLILVPLRIGSGIRIKILEMLAAGKSIITTSTGIEGIPLVDSEHIIIADSAKEMTQKITDYFLNKYDTKLMSKNGRDFVRQNYSWESVVSKFEDIYFDLIKSSGE